MNKRPFRKFSIQSIILAAAFGLSAVAAIALIISFRFLEKTSHQNAEQSAREKTHLIAQVLQNSFLYGDYFEVQGLGQGLKSHKDILHARIKNEFGQVVFEFEKPISDQHPLRLHEEIKSIKAGSRVLGELELCHDIGPTMKPIKRAALLLSLTLGSFFAATLLLGFLTLRKVGTFFTSLRKNLEPALSQPISLKLGLESISEFHSIISFVNDASRKLAETREKERQYLVSEAVARTTQMLAHDVRKPFSQLQAILDSFEHYRQDDLAKAREEIQKSVRNVEAMISDIMDFSRGVVLETQPTHLQNVLAFSLRQTLLSYRGQQNPPEILFEYNLSHQYQPLMDEERVSRVFTNILSNAIEAITILGKKPVGRIWISTRDLAPNPALNQTNQTFDPAINPGQNPVKVPSRVEITIGNDGPPFQEEDIQRIFTSFFTKGKKKGTGLGLASAEKILRLHGGLIFARNCSNGQGVEFVMEVLASDQRELSSTSALPLNSLELLTFEDTLPGAASADLMFPSLSQLQTPIKILMLEDETLYRAAVRNVLARNETLHQSVILYEASRVEDALALLAQEEDIRFAIVDIDLGEIKNGFDFLETVRTAHPQLLCMVHSNRCIQEDKDRAKALGAAAFVSKPLSFDILTRFLASHLTSKTPCKEPEHTLPAEKLLCYIVDDEPIMRAYIKLELKKLFADLEVIIKVFSDPESLMESLGQEKPDMVFSDYHFDDKATINGLELLCQIKALYPETKLFLLSNIDKEEGARLMQTHGLSGFFPPRFSPELTAAIRAILPQRPTQQNTTELVRAGV